MLAGTPGRRLAAIGSLPAKRADAAAFVSGKSIYVVGGESGKATSEAIERVAVATGKVSAAGKFEEPLAEAGYAGRQGSIYLVGGWTGSKYATAILKFAPSAKIVLLARLPQGLRSPAVALVGHTLFIAGGRSKAGPTRKVLELDLLSGKLRSIGKLPQGIDSALFVEYGGDLYLLGGRDATGAPVDTVTKIVPATGKVSAAGTLPFALAGAAAVADGKQTLVVVSATGAVYRLG